MRRVKDTQDITWLLELVADIYGEGDTDYLTFRDGWLFREMIDAVHRSESWVELPTA